MEAAPLLTPSIAPSSPFSTLSRRRYEIIASIAVAAIIVHLLMRFGPWSGAKAAQWPLLMILVGGGGILVLELVFKLLKGEFGSDLLAGLSILTSILLGEYLAGALVVLMLSGGNSLEAYAVARASSALHALARRMPSIAHRRNNSTVADTPISSIVIGDTLVVFPHETCPVDGVVIEGRGVMDESYLTGEPFRMSKVAGATVLSGSINGETALVIRASKIAADSRYAKIMEVMAASEQRRPRMRRLGDKLGAIYTPLALAIASIAWAAAGDPQRFLAVLVIATPCPLLIAIPVAIIASISLSARRGIIVKNPVVLEQLPECRTMIFDKTGTLTYGEPHLSKLTCLNGFKENEVLALVASLERYSKHPLAKAILEAAEKGGVEVLEASQISEKPGEGLTGVVAGKSIQVTSRKNIGNELANGFQNEPSVPGALECVSLIDGKPACAFRFRDEPRSDGVPFVAHLSRKHGINRVMIISGDRESEVKFLADRVGIREAVGGKSPEEKVQIVREETARAKTVYIGDGINDAPALASATVGLAFGQNSDITTEAAGAVIMDSSLTKVDEFMHISRRMRTIALQSAIGGMALSGGGMLLAAAGYLPPVAGAIAQEIIDLFAVLNALRVLLPPKHLIDF